MAHDEDQRAIEIAAQAQAAMEQSDIRGVAAREAFVAGYKIAMDAAGRYRRTVRVTVEARQSTEHPYYAAYFQGLGLFAYGDTLAAAIERLKLMTGTLIDALYAQEIALSLIDPDVADRDTRKALAVLTPEQMERIATDGVGEYHGEPSE